MFFDNKVWVSNQKSIKIKIWSKEEYKCVQRNTIFINKAKGSVFQAKKSKAKYLFEKRKHWHLQFPLTEGELLCIFHYTERSLFCSFTQKDSSSVVSLLRRIAYLLFQYMYIQNNGLTAVSQHGRLAHLQFHYTEG